MRKVLLDAHTHTVARDNNLEILRLCKKYEVPTILGSDAHISFQIADYERLYRPDSVRHLRRNCQCRQRAILS